MSEKNSNQPNTSIDEPLIIPFTPGEVLVRLSQVRGALPASLQSFSARLDEARATLLSSLERRAQVAASIQAAQQLLSELYSVVQDDGDALRVLGWPSPSQLADPCFLEVPNLDTLCVSFVLRGKQVLTSIAFDRALGATAYWLHIVRYWDENGETQRIEDPVLESYAPFFPRVRLAVGTHSLRLKTRNASTWAITDEFQIEVPSL